MSSKIEHYAKFNAYSMCARDAEFINKQKDNYPREKAESHNEYIKDMATNKKYYYGSPPRSKFLNWLGHKLLELAWGDILYR